MRHRFLIAAMFFALPAHAAEITREIGSEGVDLILVSGTFTQGDDATFRKIAAVSDKAVVALDSGGGNLLAGLEIGKAIRLRGFATAVSPGALCASACALTWLAGSPRLLDETSKLGFHAAYRLVDGKASESGSANALVGAYLNQLGMNDRAVVYVTSAPPEGVEWLTAQTAASVGIGYEPISIKAPEMAQPDKPAPHDPMSVTTAFYGAMSARLKLTGTALSGQDTVRVSYEYRTDKGRQCRGRADVQTVYAYGRTLISRIKALDGC